MPKKSTQKIKSKIITAKKRTEKKTIIQRKPTKSRSGSNSSKILGVTILLFVVVVLAFILSYLILPPQGSPDASIDFIQINQSEEASGEEVENHNQVIKSLKLQNKETDQEKNNSIIESLR